MPCRRPTARNVVNVILVDFRGLDTLGEITVLTAAAIGTVALARAGRRPTAVGRGGRDPVPPPVRSTRLVTIDVSVRVVFAVVMVGSHLVALRRAQPAGRRLRRRHRGGRGDRPALRQGGLPSVRRLSRGQPWLVLGAGLLISSRDGAGAAVVRRSLLESGAVTLDPPLLGTVKLTSALVFDIGVYLVVVGLAMMVFESFGDDPVRADAT